MIIVVLLNIFYYISKKSILNSKNHRITSYNVCYTKLLREMKWNPYMNKEVAVGEGYQIIVGLQTVSCKIEEKNSYNFV